MNVVINGAGYAPGIIVRAVDESTIEVDCRPLRDEYNKLVETIGRATREAARKDFLREFGLTESVNDAPIPPR